MMSLEELEGFEEVPTGDSGVLLCDDGQAHMFRVYDDGISDRPACRKPIRMLGGAEGDDLVCLDCIMQMAKDYECTVDMTLKAVAEVIATSDTEKK